jgi:uncharacterized protein
MPFFKKTADGISLTVYVQPRSSKNMIVGIHGEAIKVKLKAPPVDGAANKMCVQFLAKALSLPKSALEILSGHSARTKRILCRADSKAEQDRLINTLNTMLSEISKK